MKGIKNNLRALKKLARSLRLARRVAGLSMGDVGDEIGVSRQTINSWETGKSVPTLEQLFLYANAVKQDVSYFIGKAPLKVE